MWMSFLVAAMFKVMIASIPRTAESSFQSRLTVAVAPALDLPRVLPRVKLSQHIRRMAE